MRRKRSALTAPVSCEPTDTGSGQDSDLTEPECFDDVEPPENGEEEEVDLLLSEEEGLDFCDTLRGRASGTILPFVQQWQELNFRRRLEHVRAFELTPPRHSLCDRNDHPNARTLVSAMGTSRWTDWHLVIATHGSRAADALIAAAENFATAGLGGGLPCTVVQVSPPASLDAARRICHSLATLRIPGVRSLVVFHDLEAWFHGDGACEKLAMFQRATRAMVETRAFKCVATCDERTHRYLGLEILLRFANDNVVVLPTDMRAR